MQQRIVLPAAALLGFALAASVAVAQEGGNHHRCSAIADATARLACYDEAFGAPAQAGIVPVAAAAAVAVDPAEKARQEFGLSEAGKRAKDPAAAALGETQSIKDTVESIGRRPSGELVITLANGQVWSEIEAQTRTRLRPGDIVTIRKAALGSYMMVTPQRIATHVRRMK